ncbi:MAG: UvrD-helicase domain-containing protein [Gemmataceae bacterium]
MSEPRVAFTEQQQRAIDTQNVSIVLSSGAGCGKTQVLTGRYLTHLRRETEVSQLVAITFTEKAARQMRSRIRESITKEIHHAKDDTEADRWIRHLQALESASISTIHAFCGTLLRQFPLETGIAPSFEVLEEMLAFNLREESLDSTLQRLLLEQTPVADDLRHLVLLYGWRALVGGMDHLLRDQDEERWLTWSSEGPATLAQQWIDQAHQEILPNHLDMVVKTRPAITTCLGLLRRHPPLPGAMSEPVELLLRETPDLPRASDLPQAIKRLSEAAKVGRVGVKAWPDPTIYKSIKEAFEAFRAELGKINWETFEADPEEVTEAVLVGQRWIRVALTVLESYRERKKQAGVVDFQDLLTRARNLLRDHPSVRQQLQSRFKFILVDELQDTDPVQMELIHLLVGEGLAHGKLFAVGDHKQSIYRFRGAEVSLFRALRESMKPEGKQTLTQNFRSQPGILQFVNHLMADAVEDYEPLIPHVIPHHEEPCVEFLWCPREEHHSVSDARAAEAEWIVRRILSLLDAKYPVLDGDTKMVRPVRPGDVVLLFRAMSNVHIYEAAMRRHGLDYYLVGGRAFFAQQEVYDVLNLLRTLNNPEDHVSLAGTLRSPFFCLSDEALLGLSEHADGLWAGLTDPATCDSLPADQHSRALRASEQIQAWINIKDTFPIAELLQQVVADSSYDAALQMEFLGDRKLANLWKLIDLARTFDRSGLFGLSDFIARLGDFIATQPREEQAATQPEKADVIRIMSIHQAKGLEFPVVIVPDLAARQGGGFPPPVVWHRTLGCVARPPEEEQESLFSPFGWRLYQARETLEERAEDLRTLYVACTRPRDLLILSASLDPEARLENTWMQVLATRYDLDSGQPRSDDTGQVPTVRVTDQYHPPKLPATPPPRVNTAQTTPPAEVPQVQYLRGLEPVRIQEIERQIEQNHTLFPLQEPESDEVSRDLRHVLGRWNFEEKDGWKKWLQPTHAPELASCLEKFARSQLRATLGQATRMLRHVCYLIPQEGSAPLPGVEGTLDCLFRGRDGCWHLLEWLTDRVARGDRDACWQRLQPRLALASRAVQHLVEGELTTVSLVFVREGVLRSSSPRELASEGIASALRQIADCPIIS